MPFILQAATLASLALVAAALPLEGPVVGATQELSVEVRTDDLDLASRAGQKKLDARLKIAARDACGTAANPEDHKGVARCRAQAIAKVADRRDKAIASASTLPHIRFVSAIEPSARALMIR